MIIFLKFPLTASLGGAELHTRELANKFIAEGESVKLFTSDQYLFRLFEKAGISRKRVSLGWEPTSKLSLFLWPLTFLVARHRLKKLIKKLPRETTFYCQSLTEKLILPGILPSPGDGEGLGERSKIFFLEHKIPGRWLKLNPLKYRYLRQARKVKIITVSNFAKTKFVKLGVPEKNIEVAYPIGISSPGAERVAVGQERSSRFVIGILSRLDPEKGVLDFLQLVIADLIRNPSWKILVAGNGSEHQRILEFILENNLRDRITLLGFIYNLDSFFSQISVLVYPTKVPESYGMAAAEAKHRNIPVITSAVGALPEMVNDKNVGFLVKTPAEWAKFLEKVYQNL